MHRSIPGLLALVVCLGCACAEPTPYASKAGPYTVSVVEQDWTDTARDRVMPVRMYVPDGADGQLPVIVFSHGLGGTRSGYEYLGRHWASYGYLCVHIQHPGSDDAAWRGQADPMASMKAAANGRNTMQRGLDIKFALDQLEALQAADPVLRGKLDLDRVGFAGHSFGAHTTLMAIGQVFPLPGGRDFSFGDPRVKAAIALSPAPMGKGDPAKAYGAIATPCFHMTGTADSSIITDTQPDARRVPYDSITRADQYLLILQDGDHMVFSGARRHGDGTKDAVHHNLILQSSVAFWDAYLKGDPKALDWLTGEGFAGVLGDEGTFEMKRPTAPLGGNP